MENSMIKLLTQICGLVLLVSGAYINDFDQPIDFKCPSATQSITRVQSIHSNKNEDRRFDLTCGETIKDVADLNPVCYWTDYENDFDQLLHFSCPTNNYINGMRSEHDNHYEDRRWKFYCCNIPEYHLSDCTFSGWTNNYDQVQDYQLPVDTAMKGVVSLHDNHPEDRRYEYEYCSVYLMAGGSGVVG